METLTLSSPQNFHHRIQGRSPHHFHKHVRSAKDNGGHMYGHGRKHGHGHGRRGHHMRRVGGEGESLLSEGERREREWKGPNGSDGCHRRWGRGRSPVLHVPEEIAGQKKKSTVVNETAGEIGKVFLTPAKVTEDATKPAASVETDCRHGCHRGHGRHGRYGLHGFHAGKAGGFFGRDRGHGKHKFGGEHKRDRRNAPLDVITSKDAYMLLMDAPGVQTADVSVTTEKSVLTIRTLRKLPLEDKTEGERVLVRERMYGGRVRKVALPKDAVLEAATLEFSEGMLTVTVPRRPQDEEDGISTEEGILPVEGIRTEKPRGESGVDTEMVEGERAGGTV